MRKATPQQQQAADPSSSVWVSASAGTGKTGVLVSRLLRLLLSGAMPERILCITFTKAAAAEILDRVQETVTNWAIKPPETVRQILTNLLDRSPSDHELKRARQLMPLLLKVPGGMRIMTIHAFCQSTLARFPLEAGIPPGFQVADDLTARQVLSLAWQDVFIDAEKNNRLNDDLKHILNLLNEDQQDNFMNSVLGKRSIIEKLKETFGDIHAYETQLHHFFHLKQKATKKSIELDFIAATDTNRIKQIILNLAPSKSKKRQNDIVSFQKFLEESSKNLESYLNVFLTKDSTIRKDLDQGLQNIADIVPLFYTQESERALDLENKFRALSLIRSTLALTHVAFHLLERYSLRKKQRGILDYDDQIYYTARLLHGANERQWVLYKLDSTIDHILVDEAQDTSPLQWDIVTSLSQEFFSGNGQKEENSRTVFVVGDEKQSIFSFQNADPDIFYKKRQVLGHEARQSSHPWNDIPLIDNFRSSPIVLALVDAVFSDKNLHEAVTHDTRRVTHKAFQKNKPGSISLWPLIQKTTEETLSPEHRLAEKISAHIEDLLSGKIPSPIGRNIDAGDIMILVRKRGTLLNNLSKSLKNRNIPVAGLDRFTLFNELAVQDCVNAIQMALNPQDDYAMACFLKSPFIGLSEETLFTLCHKRPASIYDRIDPTTHPDLYRYIGTLAEWVQIDGPSVFINKILSYACPADTHNGLHAVIKRLGFESEDSLTELMNTAQSYESDHTDSCQEFLTWINQSSVEIKRQSNDTKTPRIRMMTVHGSKGLEAPIVILADANNKLESYRSDRDVLWHTGTEGFLWGDKSAQDHPVFQELKEHHLKKSYDEYYRLLYVALTRPQSTLIVCGTQNTRERHPDYDSWYRCVEKYIPVLTLDKDGFSVQQDSERLVVSTIFSENESDKPQETVFKSPDFPPYLFINPVQPAGLTRPLRPSSRPDIDPAVYSPRLAAIQSSYVRGQILHRLFQLLPQFLEEERQKICDRYLETQSPLEDHENERIRHEVFSVMDNHNFAPYFSPQSRSEVPMTGEITIDGKSYAVRGQVDRLYVGENEVAVLDFKTNRPAALTDKDVPESYRFQLSSYKNLLERIYPNKIIKCGLLYTAVPHILWVDL